MKQRNAFKFVVVRGPRVDGSSSEQPRPTDSERPEPVPRLIPVRFPDARLPIEIRRLIEHGVSPDAARGRVAREVIESPVYIFRNDEWRQLLDLQPTISILITDLRTPRADLTTGNVKAEIERAMEAQLGFDFLLLDFLTDEFHTRQLDLWDSYLASLIQGNPIPQHSAALLFWIRFFAILEALRHEADHTHLILGFDRIRPVASLAITGRAVRREIEPTEPDPAEIARVVAEVRARISQLTSIRDLFRRRVAARLSDMTEHEDFGKQDPLRMAANDLTSEERQVLETAGVVLERRRIDTVMSSIDSAIARERGQLRQATRRTIVSNLGGVLIRRTVRRSAGDANSMNVALMSMELPK